MQSLTLIDGSATRTLASSDRGFSYGQGVFTTARARSGVIELWDRHIERLTQGCQRLGFPLDGLEKRLKKDMGILPRSDLVVKIVLTAGSGPRGYATPHEIHPTRVIQIDPFRSPTFQEDGVTLRLCTLRLALQPRLAGIKHLNRLEQVLASSEWSDPSIYEGVMLDTEDKLVECTRSNLFWVSEGKIYTPDLSQSGVAGVMRAEVMRIAKALGLSVQVGRYGVDALKAADEVFLTNALNRIVPVASFEGTSFKVGAETLTHDLNQALTGALGG